MSQNRFEQLIEYVINDEESKAQALFHEIVVEKSRGIYENLMAEESVEEGQEESIEEDNAMGMEPEEVDADMSESLGGDQSDDLISDVESEEEGINMEGDDEFADEEPVDGDMGDDGSIEDRVVDLEDKLDELMAEFEAMMDGGEEVAQDAEDAMDSPDMTDIEVDDTELETEGMMENISLKAAPKPVTSEEGNINKKSNVAANSGARGAMASPVKMTGDTAQGRPAPTTKELIGKVGNSPAQSTGQKLSPATKPHLAQATGVNTKTPFPGR
jgi:hypothetical protein